MTDGGTSVNNPLRQLHQESASVERTRVKEAGCRRSVSLFVSNRWVLAWMQRCGNLGRSGVMG